MRILLLKDKTIPFDQLEMVLLQFKNIYITNSQITPTVIIEERDLRNLPTYIDEDGDPAITLSYISAVAKEVYTRFEESIDHLVILVHHDNWPLDDGKRNVWGRNISKLYSGYEIQQVRWDPKKTANTLGTLYHEAMHSHDSFIYRYTGVNIETLLKVKDWDDSVVHGGDQRYKYIRHMENTAVLKIIGPYLQQAYEKRKSEYEQRLAKLTKTADLLTKLVAAYRELIILMKKKNQIYGDTQK